VKPLRIFIGWDSREDIAYQVCKASLEAHSSIALDIRPLKQEELRHRGLYWRAPDKLSSTEFSFTRFLTPYLADYRGWVIFVDCDFMFRKDIAGILEYCDSLKALHCVQHDYRPTEKVKMDGQVQLLYPRKNWSSLMLINAGHTKIQALTPDLVNTDSGLNLHRFNWLEEQDIGTLPLDWNYLEGWYTSKDSVDPCAVHFTRGGPWHEDWQGVEYASEWNALREQSRNGFTDQNLQYPSGISEFLQQSR